MANGCRFISMNYRTKEAGELSRYVILVGFSYHNLVERSVKELEALLPTYTGDMLTAGNEVIASLQKALEAHKKCQQNEDYTKKGMYAPVRGGININLNDNSIQLFGMVISKTVIEPGTYKTVNSRPITILKKSISKELSVSKFREFALDKNVILSGKVNGETFECP